MVISMRQWYGSALVQIMPCRLSGAKPLPETKQNYCQCDPWNKLKLNSNRKKYLFMGNVFENVVCKKWRPFHSGEDESSNWRIWVNNSAESLPNEWWYNHNIWWRHQIETFSASLALCAGNSLVTGEFPSHKDQWRGALIFSLICTWTNGLVNDRNPGDLRRYPFHYDATVMKKSVHSNGIWTTV